MGAVCAATSSALREKTKSREQKQEDSTSQRASGGWDRVRERVLGEDRGAGWQKGRGGGVFSAQHKTKRSPAMVDAQERLAQRAHTSTPRSHRRPDPPAAARGPAPGAGRNGGTGVRAVTGRR